VQQALRVGLQALAITDHDTFAGFEEAEPYARDAGLDLVRGIELNSRLEWPPIGIRSVHVLAYFLNGKPAQLFLDWLEEQRLDRRDRNCRLVKALQQKGIEITIEEVERVGRSLTGRPHFARVLVAKGYASDTEDAFQRYIGESAPAYVERQSPSPATVISAIRSAGGVPVVAHPVRLDLDPATEAEVLLKLKEAGLLGLEVQHSDQGPQLQAHYARLATDLSLAPTGGSDFHGSAKPDIRLGTGRRNNVHVPASVLAALRDLTS
jgi:hypothetical protein